MTPEAVTAVRPLLATGDQPAAPYAAQVALCYQCKKCTSGCPVSAEMDLRPHQVVRLAQLGNTQRLLGSQAIWTCVGCYTCTTRCPQGVPVAELMYGLKRLAFQRGLASKKAPVPAFVNAFERTVAQRGRNDELRMIGRFFLATGLRRALQERAMGMKLFRQGRLPLLGHQPRGRKAVRAMLREARSQQRSA